MARAKTEVKKEIQNPKNIVKKKDPKKSLKRKVKLARVTVQSAPAFMKHILGYDIRSKQFVQNSHVIRAKAMDLLRVLPTCLGAMTFKRLRILTRMSGQKTIMPAHVLTLHLFDLCENRSSAFANPEKMSTFIKTTSEKKIRPHCPRTVINDMMQEMLPDATIEDGAAHIIAVTLAFYQAHLLRKLIVLAHGEGKNTVTPAHLLCAYFLDACYPDVDEGTTSDSLMGMAEKALDVFSKFQENGNPGKEVTKKSEDSDDDDSSSSDS